MPRRAWRLPLLAALLAGLLPLAGAVTAGDRITVNPRSAYPEGPLVRDGDLYYAEMGNDRVILWRDGANRVFWSRPGCGPTAVAEGPGDDLIVLCHRKDVIVRLGDDGAERETIDRDADGLSFTNPNAANGDGRGGVYFSSSGAFSPTAPATGAVLYLAADGRLTRVAEGIHYANGVALAPEGRTLFVSEHLSRNVLAFGVADDGSLSNRRVFVSLDTLPGAISDHSWEVGPDGLAVDDAGNLYIAEYGGGRVLVVDPGGVLLTTIAVPEAYTTGVAFSADRRRLFITAPSSMFATGGAVYSLANPVAQPD